MDITLKVDVENISVRIVHLRSRTLPACPQRLKTQVLTCPHPVEFRVEPRARHAMNICAYQEKVLFAMNQQMRRMR